MVNVDGSVWIQIVNFLFLIWVLNKILYRPIRNMLSQRQEKVTGLETAIETGISQKTEKDEAFSLGIKEARSKGMKEKEVLVKEAADEEKKIIQMINEKAQAELIKIREKIQKDTESVRLSLLKEVDSFAVEIGQKILGRAV